MIDQFPHANIDTNISIQNKDFYNFLGFNSIQKGLSSELSVKKFTKDVNLWESLTQSQKEPDKIGGFHSVIMIHDPYIQEQTEQKELAKAKKSK